jgi:hypothetical protein
MNISKILFHEFGFLYYECSMFPRLSSQVFDKAWRQIKSFLPQGQDLEELISHTPTKKEKKQLVLDQQRVIAQKLNQKGASKKLNEALEAEAKANGMKLSDNKEDSADLDDLSAATDYPDVRVDEKTDVVDPAEVDLSQAEKDEMKMALHKQKDTMKEANSVINQHMTADESVSSAEMHQQMEAVVKQRLPSLIKMMGTISWDI